MVGTLMNTHDDGLSLMSIVCVSFLDVFIFYGYRQVCCQVCSLTYGYCCSICQANSIKHGDSVNMFSVCGNL